MKKLLEWITQEGFVLNKDKLWYTPKRCSKRLKGFTSDKYTHEELIQLFTKETFNL